MIGLLANLVGPWRLYAEIAVVGVLLILLGGESVRMHAAQKDAAEARLEVAELRAKWAEQSAAAASAAVAASERNRQVTAELQRTKEEAEHARESDRQAAAATAARFASERDGLRKQLSSFAAAGDRGAADDSLAACRRRADTLGNLLAEGVRVQDELAEGAESEARNVRALLAAWPVSPS